MPSWTTILLGGCAKASMASKLPAAIEVRIVFICSSTPNRRRIRQELLTPMSEIFGERHGGIIQPIRMQGPAEPRGLDTDEISTLLRAWGEGDQSALQGLMPI